MYRVFRYHKDVPEGKLFEFPDEKDKGLSTLENEGWVDHPSKIEQAQEEKGNGKKKGKEK